MSRPVTKQHSKLEPNSVPAPSTSDWRQCRFTTAHGKRCANPVITSTLGLCVLHERRAQKIDAEEARAISQEIFGDAATLTSHDQVNRVLSKILLFTLQKRISRAEGLLYAYTCSLLLQTIVREDPEELPVKVIWDIPCPARELKYRQENQDDSGGDPLKPTAPAGEVRS
jgi:hypothetical protein